MENNGNKKGFVEETRKLLTNHHEAFVTLMIAALLKEGGAEILSKVFPILLSTSKEYLEQTNKVIEEASVESNSTKTETPIVPSVFKA